MEYGWKGMYKVMGEVNGLVEYLKKSEVWDDMKKKVGGEGGLLGGVGY